MTDRFSSRKLTNEKRQLQDCKTYEVKVDYSKLSKKSIHHLHQLFTETKWFYNYCLQQEDINNSDTTLKIVPVKVKDVFEDRSFLVLKSSMKQAIKSRVFDSCSALKSLKQNGRKIGRLKFKSRIDSVPLRQLNNTFYVDFEKQCIRLQGMKTWLKLIGLEQLPKNCEIANATLIRKASDFYVHITTFQDKQEEIIMPETSVGIDFGCNTQLTFSNNIKVEFQVPISQRLKKLDRKIMK